ncbi:MAG: hypothetical protein ACR2LQ_08805 [Acidimicrobiales bacterium]
MTRRARPARPERSLLDAGIWPNVRGKRCLHVAAVGDPAARPMLEALQQRGAAEAVNVVLRDAEEVEAEGVFDVVVATRVLHFSCAPTKLVAALRDVTRGVLLSTEPIDLWLSLLARGRPVSRLEGSGAQLTLGFNGAGHRHLLEGGGFAIERVSKPFVVPEAADHSWAGALATRLLTGATEEGTVHRALLARPLVPATA